MKNKEIRKIGLKKFTIAKINTDGMRKINGGDCVFTERPSDHICASGIEKY